MASPQSNVQRFNSSFPGPDRTDKVIAGTQMASGTIGAVAGLAPVPILKDAVGLVGHIAQIVKDVKNNQEEFKFIVGDCQVFVKEINAVCARVCETEGKLPDPLVKDLQNFVDTLKKIEEYADANTHRRRFARWLYKDLDPESIRRCREELTNRFQVFMFQTAVQTRLDLSVIREQIATILANLDGRPNGNGRTESDNSISQNTADSSKLSPPAISTNFYRPQSFPPTGQFPPFRQVYDGTDPLDSLLIREPNFPFHNNPRHQPPQTNFVNNASISFNAPNSRNVNSGRVVNHVINGENDYSVNVQSYTINAGSDMDIGLGNRGRVTRKRAGRQRRRDSDYDSDSDSYRRRRW